MRRRNRAIEEAEAAMNKRLETFIQESTKRVDRLEKREVTQATRGILRSSVADLPTPSAAKAGHVYLATDGRKSGEGPGLGTGCTVWCGDNGSGTYKWLSFFDNSEVQA